MQGFPISQKRINAYRTYVENGGKYKIQCASDIEDYSANLQHYIQPTDDLRAYLAQILERHANIAGAQAEKEYKAQILAEFKQKEIERKAKAREKKPQPQMASLFD